MRKIQEYSESDLQNYNKKMEGLSLTIDKDVLGDQKTLEVSTNVSDKEKVTKNDKEEFENYKVLYKGAIDDKCLKDYGTCDDKKLWEDIAKEMYLASKTYIPDDTKKPDGELEKKTESKKLNEEFDEDELSEIYSYLSQMKALADNIDEYWTDFSIETREKLDSLFNENGSIGYCLRWLIQALDDLIGDWETTKKDLNKLDENKSVKADTSKECSKQVEEKECSKQN